MIYLIQLIIGVENMFCENCGRKPNPGEIFCADCGTPLRTNVNGNVNSVPAPNLGQVNRNKKKPKTGLILGIVFGSIAIMIAIVVGIIAIAFSFKNKYETKEYIEFGSDKIPTVYSAVGQKSLVSFNTQINDDKRTTTLAYSDDDFTEDELIQYFTVLEDADFSSVNDDTNTFVYVKESDDSGKLVFVYGNKDYTNDTIVIAYVKTSGDINDYILENKSNEKTIRVGAAGYGYIDVPESIKRYYGTTQSDDVLQYSNESKSLLISLSCIKNPTYTIADYVAYNADDYEKDGATVKLGNETVDGYNAYTIIAAHSDGWISEEWLFVDKNNTLYYVYMGTYDDTYIFDYIETYKTQS